MYQFEELQHIATISQDDFGTSMELKLVKVNGKHRIDLRKHLNGRSMKSGVCLKYTDAVELVNQLTQFLETVNFANE